MFEWLIPSLVFLSVLMIAIRIQANISQMMLKRSALQIASKGSLAARQDKKSKLKQIYFKLLAQLGFWQEGLLSSDWKKKMTQRLEIHPFWQSRPASEWIAQKEISLLAGGLLGWLATNDWLWPLVIAVISFYLPDIWLREKRRQYQQTIIRELPNMLDLLSTCVDAGLSFEQALEVIIEKQQHHLLAKEFQTMFKAIQMGRARHEALQQMAKKVQDTDFSALVSCLIQSEKMGVSIGKTLREQATQLRQKYSEKIEKKAMEAPIKMLLPLMLFIFPIIFIILFGPILLQFFQGL